MRIGNADLYLSIRDLSCGYGGVPVLSSVSLDVPAGGILCILGRNGIGKTTLFRTLLGSLAPLSGEVLLGGKDLFRMSRRWRAAAIAYVPQSHDPPFAFTAFDIVLMGRAGLASAVSAPSKEDRLRAADAMGLLGIEHLKDRAYTKVSGGERQMILIARALCQGAGFLFLDEPAANLDVSNQMRVLAVLRDLAASGKGVVFTSHDPNHALLLGAQVAAVKSKDEMLIGGAEETVTGETARALYGVRAEIVAVRDTEGARDVKVLAPFLD
ncbi:MAG: ABC transporter ATP-binding protein [Clostridiales Family XIII bacterium]|jgi:iron complex transport system ATP-binding protein|nr:ABC transporter ATP-binding protein [Clostridiales Family XIII bacterium]